MEQQLKLAEQRAEIAVLWAIGDADGPLANEIKLGLCSRRAFGSQLKSMRASRSRLLARRVEVYVRGECAGLRLKTAIAHRLNALGYGLDKPEWFNAGSVIAGIVTECAALEHVTLMTDEQAREAEQAELMKIMDGMV